MASELETWMRADFKEIESDDSRHYAEYRAILTLRDGKCLQVLVNFWRHWEIGEGTIDIPFESGVKVVGKMARHNSSLVGDVSYKDLISGMGFPWNDSSAPVDGFSHAHLEDGGSVYNGAFLNLRFWGGELSNEEKDHMTNSERVVRLVQLFKEQTGLDLTAAP